MKILTGVVAVFLSIFSTAVMGYISMAIPIGPWIAPTLALLAIILFTIFCGCKKKINYSQEIALATSAGSVGGIMATALGFYFTTLYFLDPVMFSAWMQRPFYFSFIIGTLSLISGVFGLWVANICEDKLIIKDKLSFPIGQLVYKTISAQKTVRKSIELLIGFVSNTLFCFFRDGLGKFIGFIPNSITLVAKTSFSFFGAPILQIPMIRFDLWPMLWALGFVTGHVIAVPLVVGIIAKVLLVRPIYTLAFTQVSWMEYIITFCSGMVLATALFGFFKTPKALFKSIKNLIKGNKSQEQNRNQDIEQKTKKSFFQKIGKTETSIAVLLFFGLLTYWKFPPLLQVYIFIFSFICAYQVAIIAGKIGLAPMGKFATFVMVPAMFLFPIGSVQIVLIATIIGIGSGVAADILFGRKLAYLSHISLARIKKYQYLGIIVSALCAGIFFWFLIKYFGLGSDQLFALRAQNRWMLINTLKNANSFNFYVIFLGVIFGFVLSKAKISPLLVLGGLFMPVHITLGLVIGGIGALFVKNREKYYPFWSGVYAAGSIWMLIKAIL